MTIQNDAALATAIALNHSAGFTNLRAVRTLEYVGTAPTVVLADWNGAALSVTVEILAQP